MVDHLPGFSQPPISRRLARFGFLSALLLTGCQSAPQAAAPAIPVPTHVILSPSTAYWRQAVSDCAMPLPALGILVDISQQKNLTVTTTDWLIRSGDPGDREGYSLGKDHLAMIVNSDNPIRSLSVVQIQGIYNGFFRTWGEVSPEVGTNWVNKPVHPITYYEGDDLKAIFDQHWFDDQVLRLEVLSAPGPAEVISSVMQDESAVGYIPGKWVVSSVKIVPVEKPVQVDISLSVGQTPDAAQQELIECLQQK